MLVWLNSNIKEDLQEICDYLELSEKKDYADSGYPRNHVWRRVKRIKKLLENLR